MVVVIYITKVVNTKPSYYINKVHTVLYLQVLYRSNYDGVPVEIKETCTIRLAKSGYHEINVMSCSSHNSAFLHYSSSS